MRRPPLITLSAALLVAGALLSSSTRPAERAAPLPEVDLAALDADAIYVQASGFTGGESLSAKHPGMSTATAVTSGVVNAGTLTTSGKASPSAVVITKPVDSYTPQLAKYATSGVRLTSVIIYFTRATEGGEQDIVRLTLSTVLVKQSSLRFSSTGATSEVLTLLAGKHSLTYWPQKPDGSLATPITWCWNFASYAAC